MKKSTRPIRLIVAGLAILATACTSRPIEINVAPQQSGALTSNTGVSGGGTIESLVERSLPAVVTVTSEVVQQSPFGGSQSGTGTGTGFVIRADGIIVTNYHVVEGAQKLTVITPPPNSKKFEARVIGGDPEADLAVIKIEANDLPTLPMGRSKDLQLGESVVAMGYALALEGGPTVTTGIVSALDHTIQAQDENCTQCQTDQATGVPVRTYSHVIQTDAAINPGNSGGPLLDLNGRVVGINTAGDNQAENIGFAISIDAVRDTIQQAVSHPNEAIAYLGVSSQDVTQDIALQFNLPTNQGAYVIDTAKGGPAESAGIAGGDVIVSFDGKRVDGSEQLGGLIRDRSPGDTVEVGIIDDRGREQTVSVTLGTNPLP